MKGMTFDLSPGIALESNARFILLISCCSLYSATVALYFMYYQLPSVFCRKYSLTQYVVA